MENAPLIFFKQKASNSFDSGGASVHGGRRNLKTSHDTYTTHLPQPRHWKTTICRGIPSVISTLERMQLIHMLALFG